jgi:ELWxxDGT repeat protein
LQGAGWSIDPGPDPDPFASMAAVGGTLYFPATDFVDQGIQLWKSDGTSSGTVMVKFIDGAGAVGAEPEELTDVNGTLYFTAIAYDPNRHASLRELWKSDGTSDGTVKLTDIAPGLFELGGSDLTLDREGQLQSDRTNCRKAVPQFRFPTAAGQASCYGLSWRNLRRLAPESLVASSWRLRRLQFPTTPATAPNARSLVPKPCTDFLGVPETQMSWRD